MDRDFLEITVLFLIVLSPVLVYYMRLENRLTKIETLLSVIITGITKCPHISDKDTQ